MKREPFAAQVPGGSLCGWRSGDDGPRVLLLHGGPGMGYDYLDGLAEELAPGRRLASYQQRGVAPSTLDGPFTVEREIADAIAVLDALGWERAWVAGHSWGGHLLLHLALAAPERLEGGLAIEPLGGVGDGGMAAFDAELLARLPAEDRDRAAELDARAERGEGDVAEAIEGLRLVWPAYFAAAGHVLPFPRFRASNEAYAGVFASLTEALPTLEAALGDIRVPFGFVAGAQSPMPPDGAAGATARAIPGAWLELVDGAGHFPWFERPGCLHAALARLTRAAPPRPPGLP